MYLRLKAHVLSETTFDPDFCLVEVSLPYVTQILARLNAYQTMRREDIDLESITYVDGNATYFWQVAPGSDEAASLVDGELLAEQPLISDLSQRAALHDDYLAERQMVISAQAIGWRAATPGGETVVTSTLSADHVRRLLVALSEGVTSPALTS